MAFCKQSLVRIGFGPRGTTAGAPGSTVNSLFVYSIDDAFATVATAGYFNESRADLKVGDLIAVSCASNKGGLYIVTAAPTSGNVTVTAAVLS